MLHSNYVTIKLLGYVVESIVASKYVCDTDYPTYLLKQSWTY